MPGFIFTNKNKVHERRKINFLVLGFLIFFIIILIKLFHIQIIESDKYEILAKKQYDEQVILAPSRGLIFDRNMNLLVSNTIKVSIAIEKNNVNNIDSFLTVVSGYTKKEKQEYLQKIQNSNYNRVYIERKVDKEELNGLDTCKLKGMIVTREHKRLYHYGNLCSQVLGFTDIENNGKSGVEYYFNKQLSGKEGYMVMQKDGGGIRRRPNENYPHEDPVDGDNLVLTIDVNVQKILEEELCEGIREFNADKGKAVIISVKTGEIIAMATMPSFDPNSIRNEDTSAFMNAVISDVFEPGSTFKLITAAGSLEENIEDRNSLVITEGGTYDLYGMKIEDSHRATSMTFQQTIEQSSNIGFMKIAKKLGKEKFYKYSRDFGIGIYTGIELPSENKGMLKNPEDFSYETLEFSAIGYQVMVNSLQLAMSYSAVANNGVLMKPYILKKELTYNGKIVVENSPMVVRQVISEKTAKTLSNLLTGVVTRGTGRDARIEGVNIAGKTGTAQKYIDGKYTSSSHISSFIGYFPSENPLILISVTLDNPKSGEYYGGKVAAPIFKKITQRVLNYYTQIDYSNPEKIVQKFDETSHKLMASENYNPENIISVPNLINMNISDVDEILKEKKIKFIVCDTSDNKENFTQGYKLIVDSQLPQPYEKINLNNDITIKIKLKKTGITKNSKLKIPDVRNLSLRKAITILSSSGFKIEIEGSGKVIDQLPKPDSYSERNDKIILYCKESQL